MKNPISSLELQSFNNGIFGELMERFCFELRVLAMIVEFRGFNRYYNRP